MKNIFFLLLVLIGKSIHAQWSSINYPLPAEEINSLVYVDAYIVVGTGYENGIIYRTSNLGGNWETAISGLKGSEVRDLFTYLDSDTTFIYAATDSGLFSSINYGTYWNELSSGLTDKNIHSVFRTENYLFAGADSKTYRSTNNGYSWDEIIVDSSNSFVKEFLRSGNLLFSCLSNTSGNIIYKSEDLGQTWFPTNSNLGSSNLSSIEKLGDRLFYMSYSLMYQSTDDGTTWERIGPFAWYPSEIKSYGDYLFIGSLISEMYLVHTNGDSIITMPGSNPPFQFVSAMDVNDGFLVTAALDLNTSDNQVWIRSISDITNVEEKLDLLNDFVLFQNYPNPFNPSTNINFSIPQSGYVSLEIYNITGERVGELVSEELNAGSFNYNWNANHLSSGIYFYKISAGSFTETKKMLLMK